MESVNWLKKLWNFRKYFIIEPLLFCWILPSCFNIVAVQNLGLEKACRVNLGYDPYICNNIIEKSIDSIDCTDFNTGNINDTFISIIKNETIRLNENININYTICKAERDTQKLVTYYNGIRGPIASIWPIIVILFAGGWSDKTGLRKPCMLFPMIGEVLGAKALIISAIFFDTIPMEFNNILEKLLPAIMGGQTLMIMGIYSYLTATTDEKDRTFRFGIFAVFANVIPFIGIPFSGTLYKNLGYTKLFILSDFILILGILYLIFFIKEIKLKQLDDGQSNKEGHTNAAYENEEYKNSELNLNKIEYKRVERKKSKNCISNFFDPSLAIDCIKVLTKKRNNNRRFYLILLVLAYALFLGPTIGEIDYLYQFTLINLSWDGEQFSIFNTYSTAIVILGTFLMTAIFSKGLKASDSMVGLISSITTIISRPMFAFAKGSLLFYLGATVDMFVSTKTIAIKTIISTFVAAEELGRLYSILGITDAFGGMIFPPIYSFIYSSTLDTFPGAFYLFGEIFFIPNAILFGITYFLLKYENCKNSENGKPELAVVQINDKIETTKL